MTPPTVAERTCPACETAPPASARFCGRCGERLPLSTQESNRPPSGARFAWGLLAVIAATAIGAAVVRQPGAEAPEAAGVERPTPLFSPSASVATSDTDTLVRDPVRGECTRSGVMYDCLVTSWRPLDTLLSDLLSVGPPASDGQRLYVTTATEDGGALSAYRLVRSATPELVWRTELAGPSSVAPAHGRERVAVAYRPPDRTDGSVLALLDRRTGAMRWERQLDVLIDDLAPIVTPHHVVVTGRHMLEGGRTAATRVRVLDLADGSPWLFAPRRSGVSGMSVSTDSRTLFLAGTGTVSAHSLFGEHSLWETEGVGVSDPIRTAEGEAVAVSRTDGSVELRLASDGSLLWSAPGTRTVTNFGQGVGSMVLGIEAHPRVIGFDAADGDVLLDVPLSPGHGMGRPRLGPEGVIIAGVRDVVRISLDGHVTTFTPTRPDGTAIQVRGAAWHGGAIVGTTPDGVFLLDHPRDRAGTR